MKVLEILGGLGVGGNEIFVMNFYRAMDRRDLDIDFFVFGNDQTPFAEEIRAGGDRVFLCPPEVQTSVLSTMRYVRRFLKTHKYDVVHCHSCSFKGLLLGTVPARLAGVPKVISHSHNAGTPTNSLTDRVARAGLRRLLEWSVDYGFACSDVAGESKYGEKFRKSRRYAIIRNAIEVDRFRFRPDRRETLRRELGVGEGLLVGNVGRLAKQKNQAFLIRAFGELRKKDPQARLLIVGAGELEGELKDLARSLSLEDRVIFPGSVTNTEDYYSAMDVFVMSSLYEGLPFTAVEAQVNGLRCVFSDRITRMVDATGDNDFLSLEDPLSLWADRILARGQARCGRAETERVRREYDLNSEAKRLRAYYMED